MFIYLIKSEYTNDWFVADRKSAAKLIRHHRMMARIGASSGLKLYRI